MMKSFKSEAAKIVHKFYEKNFYLWRFKIKILLASIDLWDIVDGSKKTPPSNADSKMLREY